MNCRYLQKVADMLNKNTLCVKIVQGQEQGRSQTLYYLMVGHTIFHNTRLIVYINIIVNLFIRAFINSCYLKVHGMTNSSYLALDCCDQWLPGSTQVSIAHSCQKTKALRNF